MADRTNRPSKVRVNRSEEPPPPPPPRPPDEDELELELLELELELELDELPPGFVGVVPDVTGAAQAVVPALADAEVVALAGRTMTSAESVRPWSSVTVTRTVSVPEAGAMTVAVDVVAPVIAGGLVGAATYAHA